MCGAGFGRGADGGRCEVREGKGLDCIVYRSCDFGVVLGGHVEGEIKEGFAVGFNEGGEAGLYQSSAIGDV